ncbi:MAG: hypothetical protein ABIN83_03050 [Sphingomicrobium sp.]
MDAFSYLSVLLSVILGLAIQQVLLGYRGLALSRRHVTWYAPPLIWSVLIMAMVAQHWWASFGLEGRSDWSFASFATILIQTALFYMMAAVVLPDIPADQPCDLKAHYYREAPILFGIGAATVAWSMFREYMISGHLPQGINLAFHLLFLVMSTTVTFVKRPRFHELNAAAMAILFSVYIFLLFARL